MDKGTLAGNSGKTKRPPLHCLAAQGDGLFLTRIGMSLLACLVSVQSSFLLALVCRYFLELSLSTTGHLGSP